MNRRAFVRRMAHAALAGMLGVELLPRVPEVAAVLRSEVSAFFVNGRDNDVRVFESFTRRDDGDWDYQLKRDGVVVCAVTVPLVPFAVWKG